MSKVVWVANAEKNLGGKGKRGGGEEKAPGKNGDGL